VPARRRTTRLDSTATAIGGALGRIGLAIARRLDAMHVPVVYHSRRPRPDVAYRYYDDLRRMAADVDVLLSIVPGTAATAGMINASVFEALGPNGIFINVGRGVSVDEVTLIAALKNRTIHSAGLDVFATEPHVPEELMALPNAVLLPHVGSASVYTRRAMGQLVVDNLKSWFHDGKPLTPVPETPWPRS
jgi:lactate dehydrogenase-like 2-hydroxyacid dehydrogenase